MVLLSRGVTGLVAEHEEHEPGEPVVQQRHEGHHDRHEHDHDGGVGQQLLAGRPDDLLQLGDDLADEADEPAERDPVRLRRRTWSWRDSSCGREPQPRCGSAWPEPRRHPRPRPRTRPPGRGQRRRTTPRPASCRRRRRIVRRGSYRPLSPSFILILGTAAVVRLCYQRRVANGTTSGSLPGWPWQGRQDSNLQPAVLETAALPIAPHPYAGQPPHRQRAPVPGHTATGVTHPTADQCTGTALISQPRSASGARRAARRRVRSGAGRSALRPGAIGQDLLAAAGHGEVDLGRAVGDCTDRAGAP